VSRQAVAFTRSGRAATERASQPAPSQARSQGRLAGKTPPAPEQDDKRVGVFLRQRDAQRPELTVGLRDEHSSDRIRLVALLPERKRQFAKPPLDAIRLNVREVLAVYTRCALVGAALGKRMGRMSSRLILSYSA